MFSLNYTELNDDIFQIIDYILLYLGNQNEGLSSCIYYDMNTNLHIECDCLEGQLAYVVSYWTSKKKEELIKTIGDKQYIQRRVIPILINIYNNIPDDVINDRMYQIKKSKQNDLLLEKTKILRAICWALNEYEDNNLKLSVNTHREQNSNNIYEDVVDGHKVTLSNGHVVFDYSMDNIRTYKDGNWIPYFKEIRNNRFTSEEEREAFINQLIKQYEEERIARYEYNKSRFNNHSFDPMDQNKYVLNKKIRIRKKDTEE